MLAAELYRRGVLPQNGVQAFSVAISGKLVGTYRIADFRLLLHGITVGTE